MAQHSGFFNALLVDDVYDRKYEAGDYSDNLAVVISNGVLRSINDDLKVTATGLIPKVAVGRAWINGHWYNNDSQISLSAVVPPSGGARYDRIVLRLNTSLLSRSIQIAYIQGEASSSPVRPSITRSGDIYDLLLADIYVAAGATIVSVTDKRSDAQMCGWVYSTSGDGSFFTSLDTTFGEWFAEKKSTLASVTLFKRYTQTQTLASQTSTVTFSIPQYDADTCFIEVYVNGILDNGYTLSGSILTFDGTLVAGTVVTVNAYKSIDGTGIMTVSDEITQLQNQYATLSGINKFTYVCTGLDDNISLSQIAQAFYAGSYVSTDVTTAANAFLTAIGGNTYLGGLSNQAQITVNVVGRLGATTPFYGTGTSANRFRWFSLGVASAGEKNIIFDFAKTEKITIACAANKHNIIFYGSDLDIRNANVYAYSNGAGCPIQMIAGSQMGRVNAENCRFSISTSGLAVIAEHGTYINCYGIVVSSSSNAFCFAPKSTSLVRVVGGTFYSYIAASGTTPAIFYTYNSETNAVVIAQNINCPTVTKTGYSQQYLSVAGAGSTQITGVVSTMNSSGSFNSITGQIWKSKGM